MLRSGRVTPAEPAVTKALGFLERYIGPKGGLSEAPHSVYTTSVALMAFQEANKGGRYDSVIKGGQAFPQVDPVGRGEGKGRDDPAYGGLGYGGGNSRPDLSNTAFFIEALRDTGLPADDPALQKALIFVSRCQNLKSEFNDQPWAGKVNDGGFVYTAGRWRRPRPGNDDQGSEPWFDCWGRRSSLLCGDDLRGPEEHDLRGPDPGRPARQGGLAYIKNHYTLDENPGQGQRGLYYYYQTFAKAMPCSASPTIVDNAGKEHNWRNELVSALAKRQAA